MEQYLRFRPQYFIVYDLTICDTTEIESRFNLVSQFLGTAVVPEIPQVKWTRKVQTYKL